MRNGLPCGPAQVWRNVPPCVSLVARLNVAFIGGSCVGKADGAASQKVDDCYCMDSPRRAWTVKSRTGKVGHSGTEPASWSQALAGWRTGVGQFNRLNTPEGLGGPCAKQRSGT